jgi:hypothetical protein
LRTACEDFHNRHQTPHVRGFTSMEFASLSDNRSDGKDHGSSPLTLEEIRVILKAQFLSGEEKMSAQAFTACGCDLMSDVLAFTKPGSILLTGLTNSQVIRTAEMLDLQGVVFVRDKQPDADTIQLAKDCGIPLLSSPYPLYESCGLLFARGLRGCISVE